MLLLALPAAGEPSEPAQGLIRSAEVDLLRLQDLLPGALLANAKRFPGRLGTVEGFGAGDRYPQIWLRDSATLLPLSRWLASRAALSSWLEEHLAAQAEDGSLNDWIAGGPPEAFREWAPQAREAFRKGELVVSADKNTTETDQETSAVHAAYEVFRATGDVAWLKRPIGGQPLLQRLDRSLRYVLEKRFDKERGLALSALTADWGDVSPVYPDQRAIYLDERTPQVVGLYTNAMLLRAEHELALLGAHAADGPLSAFWWQRAEELRRAARRTFWQPKRGFFRMHVIVTPELARRFPDTSDVFALGGNALALESGLADDEQAASVLKTASARRKRYELGSVAAVLLPPLPRKTFLHPVLRDPWRYQNGGQWDWFAGRLIASAFARGHSEWARTELLAIARRVSRSGGIYEWYSRDGRGQGSPRYAGAAGALAEALLEGLHGVSLGVGRLDLRVRLGPRDGALDLCQPSDGACVAYEQRYERGPRRLRLRVHTNARLFGSLAVLLPAGLDVKSVTRGGQKSAYELESLGEDRYARLEAAWDGDYVLTFRPARPKRR